ncbi:putative RNA-directed DNA polymerase from transposon X-element [Trichonephila clavipes]|nr:putative RNA-directed DNA polymerase from transposon X-element [Trichonephila clavipes]
MNRCPDLVVCLKRDLQCLRPEASLVLIYRPNVAGMKGRVDLAQPVNRTPDLCCLSKLMEHIVSARLMFHLESHNLLSPLQSGFRKSRSTTDNLRLETSIREAFVKKQYNISVFFDIKKAYDMSWRELFSDYESIFTDGSKSESHVGSAVVSLSTVITDALPISASIYTAELHALRIALEHISLSCGKKFIIYTDSLSALQSIV